MSGVRADAPMALADAQLDQVTAGITKMVNKASPKLITAGSAKGATSVARGDQRRISEY